MFYKNCSQQAVYRNDKDNLGTLKSKQACSMMMKMSIWGHVNRVTG